MMHGVHVVATLSGHRVEECLALVRIVITGQNVARVVQVKVDQALLE